VKAIPESDSESEKRFFPFLFSARRDKKCEKLVTSLEHNNVFIVKKTQYTPSQAEEPTQKRFFYRNYAFKSLLVYQ